MPSVPTPVAISRRLSRAVENLEFAHPITHTYNPLAYARRPHEQYLSTFAHAGIEVLMVGMNPGPWGMVQTGIPFGEVASVRDWLGIEAKVLRPLNEHPRRPIEGFACKRSEVSGARLWGWARERFQEPEHFFSRFFVHNYCPLAFMEDSGRNFTPDKLPRTEQRLLFDVCDEALSGLVNALQPALVVGVGAFAEARIRAALPNFNGRIGRVLHPSPASPAANRGWSTAVTAELRGLGIVV